MSAKFRIESGSCYGRDFAVSSDANIGMCSKLTDFMLRPNVSGSAQVITSIDHTNDIFNLVGHGYLTNDIVVLMGGTLPAGFTLTTSIAHPLNMTNIKQYYVIKVNDDSFRLASTRYNSALGTYITFVDNGSGTITVTKLGGGANWYKIEDYTEIVTKTFLPADVNITNETITIVDHGFSQYMKIKFSSTIGLPGGLVAGTTYYLLRVDKDTMKIYSDTGWVVLAGNVTPGGTTGRINLTSQGTGVHTIESTERFNVFCDTSGASPNDYNTSPSGLPPKYVRIGFLDSEAGYVRIHGCLYWNATTHTPYAMWTGGRVATSDAATFAYDFRGGDESIFCAARLGSTWSNFFIDQWIGIASLVEPMTAYGVVQSGLTAGSSVVVQLGATEAANFNQDKYYYIYDFVDHSWINYFKVTNVNLGADQITISNINQNFPAGAVITSYAHRFYSYGLRSIMSAAAGDNFFINSIDGGIPYCSSTTQNYIHQMTVSPSWGSGIPANITFAPKYNDSILATGNPDDEGNYFGMRYLIGEKYDANYTNTTSMNRIYGRTSSWIRTYRNVMAQMLDYRIMDGKNWLMISDSGTYISCYLHSESTV